MVRLELIQVPNRRMHQRDRRECVDRRGQKMLGQDAAEAEATLRELLFDAHAKIRTLERTVETLKEAI